MTKPKQSKRLNNNLVRIAKIHFFLVFAYIVQIIAYDSSKLITPDVVLKRWYAVAALCAVTALIWYLARDRASTTVNYKLLAWLLIAADIAFAAFNVYSQRGMASRAVFLFVIPILVSAVLMSRVALFAVAIISMCAYTTASVAYFVNNFNEGYKVELYGEILFYSALLIVVSALLWPVVNNKSGP